MTRRPLTCGGLLPLEFCPPAHTQGLFFGNPQDQTTTELAPPLTVADLPTALAAVRHVARPDWRLLIDTMHVIRSGSTVADVAALDSDLIGHAQLCDATLVGRLDSYFEELMFERMVLGECELRLRELPAVLPAHRV